MPIQIVLFMEPTKDKWAIQLKLGRLYMNRFVIDENAKVEVIRVIELKESWHELEFEDQLENEWRQKGSNQRYIKFEFFDQS